MTFSIVIPTYNGDKYIEKAILSALSQSRKPDEIIVHDDNSTDQTINICKKFESQIKIYLNTEGPSGFVNGWKRAINFATSDYIAILHQDDILYSDFLEEAETILNKNKDIKHLFSLCDYIDENDNLLFNTESVVRSFNNNVVRFKGQEYVEAYQKNYNGIPHIHRCPGVITHRTIFENHCMYNVEAGHIADDDFFYRVGQYSDVIGIIKPLAAYRHHQNSETSKAGTIELVRRLTNDYVFQVKQWENSTFLDKKNKFYFEFWAIKYLTRFAIYALRSNNKHLIEEFIKVDATFRKSKLSNYHLFDQFKLSLVRFYLYIKTR